MDDRFVSDVLLDFLAWTLQIVTTWWACKWGLLHFSNVSYISHVCHLSLILHVSIRRIWKTSASTPDATSKLKVRAPETNKANRLTNPSNSLRQHIFQKHDMDILLYIERVCSNRIWCGDEAYFSPSHEKMSTHSFHIPDYTCPPRGGLVQGGNRNGLSGEDSLNWK